MSDRLDCGHPVGCIDEGGECAWCEEVEGLNQQIAALTAVCEGNALIIEGGHVQLRCAHIGYLSISGGEVYFDEVGQMTVAKYSKIGTADD